MRQVKIKKQTIVALFWVTTDGNFFVEIWPWFTHRKENNSDLMEVLIHQRTSSRFLSHRNWEQKKSKSFKKRVLQTRDAGKGLENSPTLDCSDEAIVNTEENALSPT